LKAQERKKRGNRGWGNWAAFLPIAAGFVVIMAATPHGIGLSPDSVAYIGGARNILVGEGFSMPPGNAPITHLAPFYSFVLAGLGVTGQDPAETARWLSAALFGGNLLLIYLLALRAAPGGTRSPAWIAAGVAAFALASRPMWEIHLMAWTEPLFVAFALAAIWLTTKHLEARNVRWLGAAGAAVALAVLTRYAGLALWAALCLVPLLFQSGPVLRRVRHVALFSAIALTPFLMWAVRNFAVAGTATNRSVSLHPVGGDRLHEGLATVASWLMVPDDASGWAKLLALAALGLVLVLGVFLRFRREDGIGVGSAIRGVPRVVGVAALSAGVYLLFLLVSISTADANTPLDQRILSPLFAFLLIPLAFALHAWSGASERRRLGGVVAITLLCFAGLAHARMASSLFNESYREGIGFNSLRWRDSDLVRELKQLGTSEILYSNAPDAVYLHTGRAARRLPTPINKLDGNPNPNYRDELLVMREVLENGGLFVYFDLGGAATAGAMGIVRQLDLVERIVYPNGAIYSR
jgi:hypothetical protein